MDPRELRAATRAEHEATEALMPLMGPDLTRQGYRATLEVLLGIVGSWESWAAEYAPEGLAPLLAPRRRTHMLEADLATLGWDGRRVPEAAVNWTAVVLPEGDPNRDRMTDGEFEARFLGAMYVMEGSTLGGRFLAKEVETSLALLPGQGNAYFQGHGEATGGLWREVTGRIAAVPEELSPGMVSTAKATFVAFGDALRRCGVAQTPVRR